MRINYEDILRRAWNITWNYRALWPFGFILALTGAGGGTQFRSHYSGHSQNGNPPPDLTRFLPHIPPEMEKYLVVIAASLACLFIILLIAATVARYVARTSLLLMVDEHEEGTIHTWKEGLGRGWSSAAFRLFLMELSLTLPIALVVFILVSIALLPLLGWATGSLIVGILGTMLSLAMLFPIILVILAVTVAIAIFLPIARRVCVLEGAGVGEALTGGYRFVRAHLSDVVVMWAIMLGVKVLWLVVLMPVLLLALLIGAAVGGMLALAVGGLASLFAGGLTPWILGGAVGLPVFLLIVSIPVLFLQGLMEVFKSSAWTLAYREMRALGTGTA